MSKLETLKWYWSRMSRMSSAEILHRVEEQLHRRQDRCRSWGWGGFGQWDGIVAGLPGFTPAALPGLVGPAQESAAAALAGSFQFLGQEWPAPKAEPWWRGEAWFRDPTTGETWPGADVFAFDVSYRHERSLGDVKFVWEVNRLQFLPAMALGGEADAAWDALDGWMDANPPYQGINWTGGIEAASRLVSLLALIRIASPPESLAVRVRAFVAAHARWIDRYPSRFSSANNHRVAELTALFLCAVCAPGLPHAARYGRETRAELEREVLLQFHSDGIGAEQSPTYAAYSLEWFALAGIAAETFGIPFSEPYRARVRKAAEALVWMLDDQGLAPRIGDDDEGRVLSLTLGLERDYPRSVAALALRWLGERAPATGSAIELRDGLAVRTVPVIDSAPFGLKVFESGGYSVSRRPTSRGTAVLIFDHAPLGLLSIAAHGHADALAVWLSWGEEVIFADAGTFLYHSGDVWRDQFRGTAFHNTLAIEDRNQSRIAGAFNWSAHANAHLVDHSPDAITADHDGYVGEFGLTHRRSVTFSDNAYSVSDKLLGQAKRSGLGWSAGFTLAPGVATDFEGQTVSLKTDGGRRATLRFNGAKPQPKVGHYSDAFNRRQEVVRIELTGGVDTRGADSTVLTMQIVLDQS